MPQTERYGIIFPLVCKRMISKKVYSLTIFAIVSLLVASTVQPAHFVNAEKNISPKVLKECENLYLKYRELGETAFKKQYAYKNYISDCIKLYKDPNWSFPGKEKIDKYFDKIDAVKKQSTQTEKKIQSVKVLNKLKMSEAKYYIKMQACASENSIIKPTFLIQSDIDKFLATSSKSLQADTCMSYGTTVFSKYPNSISVIFVSDPSLYSSLKVKAI